MPTKRKQFEELGNKMSQPGFWDNQERAQGVVGQLSALKSVVEPVEEMQREVKDLAELYQLAADEGDTDELTQLETDVKALERRCQQVELQGLLSGPQDMRNCFFGIHAGAGGTESCDWASMLLRMYTRYFDTNKFKYEELDITPGEEAGIRSITLRVIGPFAFGKLSCEMGVHRLVRISPFDANARRHTSFAAVDVLPELPETDLTLKENDLRDRVLPSFLRGRRAERQQGLHGRPHPAHPHRHRRRVRQRAKPVAEQEDGPVHPAIEDRAAGAGETRQRDEQALRRQGRNRLGQPDPQLRAPALPVGQGPPHRL